MKVLKEILSWVKTIALAIIIAVIINVFIMRPSQVLGESMEPGLHNGNFGLVYRISRTLNILPDYGDIVIIDSRVEHKHSVKDDLMDTWNYNLFSYMITGKLNHNYWVKRVIGKPGDTIQIKNGAVYRDGKKLSEPYIKEPMYDTDTTYNVPKGYIFVMGDNRNNSKDSRIIGPVPVENVLGKYILNIK